MRKYIILIALMFLLAACGKPQATGATSSQPVQLTGDVKEFTVRAFQFGYDPGTIEVNLGDKVIIHAYSDDVPHGLSIRDFGVEMSLIDKDLVTAEFIADKDAPVRKMSARAVSKKNLKKSIR